MNDIAIRKRISKINVFVKKKTVKILLVESIFLCNSEIKMQFYLSEPNINTMSKCKLERFGDKRFVK